MKPTIICLTPVRNEAWILDRFLKAASLWADYIIIADQMSTDGSREIAQKYSKVILIDNPSETFNEPDRQKLLITEARKITGPRLLITLDADEMFTPNLLISIEWKNMLRANPGTIFKFQWANFRQDFKSMWFGYYFPWGYMDDGFEHNEHKLIHTGRIPLPLGHEEITINEIKVIHFQFTVWERMKSKHRFYQCFEVLNFPGKSAVDIFRQYHHMLAIPKEQIIQIPEDWIRKYNELGIDITTSQFEPFNWFDDQILKMMEQYGSLIFKQIAIWDVDWVEQAKLLGKKNLEQFKNPGTRIDRLIQGWLFKTQSKVNKRIYRRIDKIIKILFHY